MQTSVSDTVNLAASVVTIAGGVATFVGFMRKMLTTPGQTQPRSMKSRVPDAPVSQAPGAVPWYPQQPGYSQQPGYPQQPAYPPPAARPPIYGQVGGMRPRVPHPVILGFAAVALVCVMIYSVELLFMQGQTIPAGSPLIVVNGVLVTVNVIAGAVAGIGMLVSSARAGAWRWFAFAILGLLVLLITIGILSVVLLGPACFYALYMYPANVRVAQPIARR